MNIYKNTLSKFAIGVLALAVAFAGGIFLTSCGESSDDSGSSTTPITVVAREAGSGTRSAFAELFEVQDSNKVDQTTDEAVIANSTESAIKSVEGDKNAIGYISLGSLKNTVKALEIEGVEPTINNVRNGSYTVTRPFNIATKADLSQGGTDFINYILSTEGQKVIADAGYIDLTDVTPFVSTFPTGTLKISGSSSVHPAMEKLVEAYKVLNPALNIQLQSSDSTTGVNDAIAGLSEIAMASRELKSSEIEKGLTATQIATDGLAVIVNKSSAVTSLTKEQVKDIFKGEITSWSALSSN